MSEAGVPKCVGVGRAEVGLIRSMMGWLGVKEVLTSLQSRGTRDGVSTSDGATLSMKSHRVPLIRQLTNREWIVSKFRNK